MQRRMAMAAFLSLALAAFGCDSATEDTELFQTTLAGSNEVPGNGSAASGACGLQIDGQRVLYSVEVHGLGNIIGAHIHVAPSGANGPIRVVFIPSLTSTTVILPASEAIAVGEGILTSGSFGPGDVRTISFDQLVSDIRAGNTYCNVHTTRFPGGEIRGNFVRVTSD
jgi:CHRD domain-containing protein